MGMGWESEEEEEEGVKKSIFLTLSLRTHSPILITTHMQSSHHTHDAVDFHDCAKIRAMYMSGANERTSLW